MRRAALRGALGFIIGDLDPVRGVSSGAMSVLAHMHDPLQPRHVATGGLLTGPPVAHSSSEVLLTLHPDARFHDGAPVRSVDVVSSIQRTITASQGSPVSTLVQGIDEAIGQGESTVLIRCHGHRSRAVAGLAAVRVLPAECAHGDLRDAPGTGPYQLRSATPLGAELRPSSVYRHPSAQVAPRPVLELQSIVSTPERIEALVSGHVDVIEDAYPSTRDLEDAVADGRLRRASCEGNTMAWLIINCGAPGLQEPSERRRLLDAASSLVRDLPDEGFALSNGGWLPAGHPESRWVRGVPAPAGPAPEARSATAPGDLRLLVSSVDWLQALAEPVRLGLGHAGWRPRLQLVHTADAFGREVPAGEFDILLGSGDPTVFSSSAAAVLAWYLTGPWASSYCHWSDKQGLASQLSALIAQNVPAALRTATAIAHQEAFMRVLGHRSQSTAWRRDVHGVVATAASGLNLRQAHSTQ